MFKSLLSFGRRPNHVVTNALYEAIVASARQPHFYSAWDVPDSPIGRFEMLSLHMFLFLERARDSSTALSELAQDMTDEFFKDVDHSLRELGIGDMGVPKRMKKLAKMFYGRAESYRTALAEGNRSAFAAALTRNVMPERAGVWPQAIELAAYAERASAFLATQDEAALLSGRVEFPDAAKDQS
jgi:cytochrome b pre-mRNA-processing protein 3